MMRECADFNRSSSSKPPSLLLLLLLPFASTAAAGAPSQAVAAATAVPASFSGTRHTLKLLSRDPDSSSLPSGENSNCVTVKV
jgi:hypothetical protein